MAFTAPFTIYRPIRATDGQGGFTESPGTGRTIYLTVRLHDNALQALVDKNEDVKTDDIIADDAGAHYRVGSWHFVPGTRGKQIDLSRMERPIAP